MVCTLAIPVRERTSELAVFKAGGFPDFLLLFPILAESLLIAVIGGTLGLILASLAMPFLVKARNGMFRQPHPRSAHDFVWFKPPPSSWAFYALRRL